MGNKAFDIDAWIAAFEKKIGPVDEVNELQAYTGYEERQAFQFRILRDMWTIKEMKDHYRTSPSLTKGKV